MNARLDYFIWALLSSPPVSEGPRLPLRHRVNPITSFELSGHFTTRPDFWYRLEIHQRRRERPATSEQPDNSALQAY